MLVKKTKKTEKSETASVNDEKSGRRKGSRKAPFYIGLVFLLIVFGAIYIKARASRDFSFSFVNSEEKTKKEGLFAEPVKNIVNDSPEMVFCQENSIKAVSCPYSIDPKSLGSIVEAEGADTKSEGGVVEYIVESEDTMDSIAKKFNISIDTILWANNLTSKTVKAGQSLTILPVDGVVYLVKEGDTISNIAKKYKGNEQSIIAFNSLSGENDVYIGDMLIIPGGKITPEAKKPVDTGIPLASSYFINPTSGKITQGPHGALRAAIDVANSCGTPIVAAAGGKVQRAGWIDIGGNSINILHPNGVVTYYGHFSAMTVVPGQTVSAGEVIGYMGRTGLATGCHLHFEVRGAKNFLARYYIGSYVGRGK
jgi:LysM repeat protein